MATVPQTYVYQVTDQMDEDAITWAQNKVPADPPMTTNQEVITWTLNHAIAGWRSQQLAEELAYATEQAALGNQQPMMDYMAKIGPSAGTVPA
jgi:hypothetical protein